MNNLILLAVLITGLTSCNQNEIKIINKPIDFSENRVRLTLDYIGAHYGIYPKDITINKVLPIFRPLDWFFKLIFINNMMM